MMQTSRTVSGKLEDLRTIETKVRQLYARLINFLQLNFDKIITQHFMTTNICEQSQLETFLLIFNRIYIMVDAWRVRGGVSNNLESFIKWWYWIFVINGLIHSSSITRNKRQKQKNKILMTIVIIIFFTILPYYPR